MSVNFYDVLKAGYKNKKSQEGSLTKNGYIYDKDLSSDNHQTYYNPSSKKLIYNVTGTHNLKDVITDAYLAFGSLKNTSRYKEDDKILRKSKEKYGVNDAIITGHSLGGSIASKIAKNGDKSYSLDSGFTFGQKGIKSNNKEYRSNDFVSILGSNKKNMHTLKNNNSSILKDGILGNAYKSHDVDNIRDSKIFI